MRPQLWSFRTFGALWGILLSPLVPCLADGRDMAEVLPADTLAYVGWPRPYERDDAAAQIVRQFAEQAGAIDVSNTGRRVMVEAIRFSTLLMESPAGIALLDVRLAEQTPDVQLALLVAAGDQSARLAASFAELLQTFTPDVAVEQHPIGGTSVQVLPLPDTPLSIYWGAHRGYFLATLGQAAAAKVIARLDGTAEGPSLSDSAELKFVRSKVAVVSRPWRFTTFANVKGIVAKARALVEGLHGPLPPQVDKLIEALGINSICSAYIEAGGETHRPVCETFVHVQGERKGLLKLWEQKPLTNDDLALVPKDAYWARVCNFDLAGLWSNVRDTIEEVDPNAVPMVEGALAMASGFLGVSITEQLLPAFGDTCAAFDAPDHGGILLTGSVLVVEVNNPDAVQAVLARVVELLRPPLLTKDVNLTLQETVHDGRQVHSVIVGGVPVPVAPSWTLVDNWMVFGLFPQTVLVAARQVDPKTRAGSILDRPAVRDALGQYFPNKIQSFSFVDARYFGRLLYPLGLLYSTAMTSMLSLPGVKIDPTFYPDIATAVENLGDGVGFCAADEDGIHQAQVGPMGNVLVAVAVVALVISILLPSLSRARELAKRAVSASNLRGIGQGCYIYAHNHGDGFPESLQLLIDEGMATQGMLESPRDPQAQMSPEQREKLGELGYIRPNAPTETGAYSSYIYISGQSEKSDSHNVLAYERIIGDEGTDVLFVDGHVEWMKLAPFKQALLETYQRLGREDEMPADLRP